MARKTLIVDLGGVVFDNHAARLASFKKMWHKAIPDLKLSDADRGRLLQVENDALSRAVEGDTPANAARKVFASLRIAISDTAAAQIKEKYDTQRRQDKAAGLEDEPPFEGVADLLRTLKRDYDLVAISRKDEKDINEALEKNGFGDLFVGIVSTHHQEKTAQMLKDALAARGINNPAAAALIGDTLVDMTAAGDAKMLPVMARWGQVTKREYEGVTANTMEALPSLLTVKLPSAKLVSGAAVPKR